MSDNENIKYQDFEEFNSYIDEEGFSSIEKGLVSIYGNRFKPSQVLFMMDEIAYKEAYEEYLNNLFEDNKNTIFSEFPSHIAVNFRKLYNGNMHIAARDKLDYVIDCSESIINFLFYLVISELRSKGINISGLEYQNRDDDANPDYRKLKAKDFFTDTFKLKIRILQAIVNNNYLEDNDCFSKQLKSKVLEALIDLNQVRNDTRHSGTLSNDQYEMKFQIAYGLLNYIIPDLMFLKECKILNFVKFERGTIFCTAYEGDSSVQKIVNFESEPAMLSTISEIGNDVLFAKCEDVFIKLTPYLHFKTEYEGHDSIICTFKRLSEGQFIFEHSKTKQELKFEELKETFNGERTEVTSIISV